MPSTPPARLRASLHLEPIVHEGHRAYALSDRLHVATDSLVLSPLLAAALSFFDGKRNVEMIGAAFSRQYGQTLPNESIVDLVQALDEATMLDNARGQHAYVHALTEYRNAPHREPICAGTTYPEEKGRLRHRLNEYLEESETSNVKRQRNGQSTRAILSPHIDYQRGGRVYASAWRQIEAEANAAEVVVIIGTDHYCGALFTLTKQHYATPYGTLPTAQGMVDVLAEAVGREAAFENELYHSIEHSLELPLVWLQHIRNGNPVEVVPVLVGSFHSFYRSGSGPMGDVRVRSFLDALHTLTQTRRTLVIASGDMAHVGPAFDGEPLDDADKAQLKIEDDGLIDNLNVGSAESFWNNIARTSNKNNVCGAAPFYLTLKHLDHTEGHTFDYEMCPADKHNTSVVSICGTLMR